MVGLRALAISLTLALSIGFAQAAAASALSPAGPNDPTVDLGYSTYEGTALANGQNQWLGVRFGAPPIGNNRFRKAQPPATTSGIQSAKSFGNVCYGQGGPRPGEDPNMFGEDCLFMNIWGPSNFTSQSKVPVFFWLSGGAYIRTANANYNGTGLVAAAGNDMIFISINYRVGPFGFLASEEVRANGDLNAGLYDQRTALEWIQEHITKFGGDPNQVVLVGDSAGAGSIAMHLITKSSERELFAGIFGVSPFFPTQLFPSDLEWQFDEYCQEAGCGNAPDRVTCLRQQDVSVLQAANQKMAYPGRPEDAATTWTPTIDGDLVPDIPFKLFTEGKFRSVPSIWGVDTDEATLFAPNASTLTEVGSFLQNNYPELSNSDVSRVLTKYQDLPPRSGFAPFFPAAAESYGDITFTCPGLLISSIMKHAGMSAWNYRYNVPTQQGIAANTGVYHMAEVPLLFGLGNTPIPDPGAATYPMEPILQSYYTNFVRFLNPNVGKPVPITWPQWTIQPEISPRRLLFQVNNMTTEPVPYNGTQSQRCAVWVPGKTQQ